MSYNVFDLNYDRNLIRAGAYPEENLETRNAFNEGVAPDTMLSGGLGGNITIVDGYLKSDNFVDGVSGWQLTPTSAQLPDLTIVGGTIKYQKDSFTDDTQAGYYISSEGLYVGSASDTTKLKYSLDTGEFDFVGTVSGRSTATLASAINPDGNLVKEVINTKLDTSAEQILADFTFGESGAIKMITDANNGLWISPTGILAKKSGNITLTITNAGSATFAGTLSAAAGTLGTITLTSGGHIKLGQTAYNTGTGFWLGDDSGTAKLSIGSSTKHITWDGSNLNVVGGTITSGVIQTGTSGRRIRMISGTPGADLFNTIESMYGNDVVGNLAFGYAYATDSSSFRLAAYGSSVEGNAKSNLGYAGLSIYGGSYYFGLDWYGGSTSTARITNNLRIDSDWHPYTNNSYSLGSSTYKWKNLYLAGNASIGGNIYVPDNFNVYIDGSIRVNIQDTVSYFQNTVAPWSSNTYNLGASSYRWKNIYLSNAPDVSSSKELKKDIRPTKYGLSEIRRLEPVEFSLLDDDINQIGFIAEDVCKILPEVSSGQSMKPTMLIPVLVNAIKELDQRVQELEKKI